MAASKTIIELVVLIFNLALARWKLLLIPPLLALPVAIYVHVNAPKTYQSQATIILSPATSQPHLGDRTQPTPVSAEQIRTLELWLKSDRILTDLVRKIYGDEIADSKEARNAYIGHLRRSIALELSGRTLLQLRMDDGTNVDLGRKLEIVLAHLMESLIEPDRGLLTASRLLIIQTKDQVRIAKQKLTGLLKKSSKLPVENSINILDQIQQIKTRLSELLELQGRAHDFNAQPTQSGNLIQNQEVQELTQDLEDLRKQLTEVDSDRRALERSYDKFTTVDTRLKQLTSSGQSQSHSNLATIGSPEKLVIVGRPSDPEYGRSSGLKFAVLILFVGIASGTALALLFEFLSSKVRTKDEVERLTNQLVIARLPYLPSQR